MRINNNIISLQAATSLNKIQNKIQKSVEKMSSGYKINSSKDDSASLSIANKLSSQLKGIEMANKNSLDGISLIQIAEGALSEITSILQRMRELSIQSSNDTLAFDDREKIQFEIDSLKDEINSLSFRTEFNGIKILKGEVSRLGFSNDDAISKVKYISDSVEQGYFTYDILSVGVPAKRTTSYPLSTGVGGILSINNEKTTIYASDTSDQILQKLRDIGNRTGIDIIISASSLNMLTNDAGSSEKISISTNNPALSASLGFVDGTTYGIDAKISNVTAYSANGNLDDNFNSSMLVLVDGNRVDITSNHGKKISLDINIKVDNNANFLLGDNTSVTDAGIIPTLSMNLEVKGYGPLKLQVGFDKNMEFLVSIPEISTQSLGIQNLNYLTTHSSEHAIDVCDRAISEISKLRSKLGAYENRLEYTARNLDVASTNFQTTISRIKDTDMAKEMTKYTQYMVVSQAGMSILAQANQRPQQILQLLQ